jgi:hypothetical protein
MVRVALTGLLLASAALVALAGCAPRSVVALVPTLDVRVHDVEGHPLVETEPDPREDGRTSGDLVEVEWRRSWYAATLLERRGARWLVHYDGYGKEWDEVVAIERIRDRRAPEEEPVLEPMDEDVDP